MHPDHKLSPVNARRLGELIRGLQDMTELKSATTEDKRLLETLLEFHDEDERGIQGYTVR